MLSSKRRNLLPDRIHHEPLDRPLGVVALEIFLTLAQAYLVGVTALLAIEFVTGFPQPQGAVILGILSLGVALGYLVWLLGGEGQLMTIANVLVLAVFAGWLAIALADATQGELGVFGPTVDLAVVAAMALAVASALLGILCGLFLHGPRRRRWHDPHRRAVRVTRAYPEVAVAGAAVAEAAPDEVVRSPETAAEPWQVAAGPTPAAIVARLPQPSRRRKRTPMATPRTSPAVEADGEASATSDGKAAAAEPRSAEAAGEAAAADVQAAEARTVDMSVPADPADVAPTDTQEIATDDDLGLVPAPDIYPATAPDSQDWDDPEETFDLGLAPRRPQAPTTPPDPPTTPRDPPTPPPLERGTTRGRRSNKGRA